MTAGKLTRLLISARDIGAAHDLTPIIAAAVSDPMLALSIVASEPAYSEFKQRGLRVELFDHAAVAINNGPNAASLFKATEDMLARHAPDIILTGLSGIDAGVDEAIHVVASAPTIALQEFWGDVNPNFPNKADFYLVIKQITGEPLDGN